MPKEAISRDGEFQAIEHKLASATNALHCAASSIQHTDAHDSDEDIAIAHSVLLQTLATLRDLSVELDAFNLTHLGQEPVQAVPA